MAENKPDKPSRSLARRIPSVIGGLLVLACVSAVAVESWRQWDIHQAKQECDESIATAVEPLAHVSDWENWYKSRIRGSWGGEEYYAWVESVDARDDLILDLEVQDELDRKAQGDVDTQLTHADAEELRSFLDRTSDAAAGVAPLFRYETLTGVPRFNEAGMPRFIVLDQLTTIQMLSNRVKALTALGNYDAAWIELLRLYKLSARMQQASSYVQYAVNIGVERYNYGALQLLCSQSFPPEAVVSHFPLREPPDISLHLAECELSWWAQHFNAPEPDEDAEEWEYAGESWFAWVGSHEDYDRDELFSHAARKYREVSTSASDAREMYDGAKEGREPELSESHGYKVFSNPRDRRAGLWIIRQAANLLIEIRSQEASGVPLDRVELYGTQYPDYEWDVVDKGIEVRYARTKRVFRVQEIDNWPEGDYDPSPFIISPLK